MFTKWELRMRYLQLRDQLTKKERVLLSEKICENLILQLKPAEDQSIHVFLPIITRGEIDTWPFIKHCWKSGAEVFVPKVVGDEMIPVPLKSNTVLVESRWGIPEPESDEGALNVDYDYVITPLLYADAHGNRVGYGKGFYDRFFARINRDALKVGVNYFPPREEISDVFTGDFPLDKLVLPEEILSFGFGSKSTK